MAAVTLLTTQGLSRQFGGLNAVSNVDFTLQAGEIRTIIGPNGAGKTTLVGMICGRIGPSAGRISFEGQDITRLRSWERVARGIAYTFQITSIFQNLSCYDNVALAAQRQRHRHADLPDRVMDSLDRVGLASRSGVIAGTLGVGLGVIIDNLPSPNDGTVAVEETRLPGIRDHIEIAVTHTGLLVSALAASQTAYFLRHGEFARPGAQAT